MKLLWAFLIVIMFSRTAYATKINYSDNLDCLSSQELKVLIESTDSIKGNCKQIKSISQKYMEAFGISEKVPTLNLTISREELRNRLRNADKGIY